MAMRASRMLEADHFGKLLTPGEAIEPILAQPVRDGLLAWLTEIFAEDELKEMDVKPRTRAIFNGVPGVGKTTLAHHLAARLGLDLLAVRPERLIDCWMGSTGRNIGELFDLSEQREEPLVLFLDEFDALATERRQATQGSDDARNEWVNTLLQRLEQYEGIVIAATNFGDRIDQAIWRRFDMHITLTLPGQHERERILARYLEPFGLVSSQLRELAISFETASPALIRHFCENLKRDLVVGPKLEWPMDRDHVISRILATVHPHPDVGKPRLWSRGTADNAIIYLDWPLPRVADLQLLEENASAVASQSDNNVTVIEFDQKRG